MTIGEIIRAIESMVPAQYQESWDNTGLQVGSPLSECTGVLICVDVTDAVINEAVSLGANLIVSHHPLIFKGLKRLTGATRVEAAVINAIGAGMSIYSCHTSVDSVPGGVSWRMAGMLGVTPLSVLSPMEPRWTKVAVMVPTANADEVRMAMFEAGAGEAGSYDCCSYNVEGMGTFRALAGANPYVGAQDELHREPEVKIESIVPRWLVGRVTAAIREVHPYECPAIDVINLANEDSSLGLGVVGNLETPLTAGEFMSRVAGTFDSPAIRHSVVKDEDAKIRRVAMCGGSGGEFIRDAIKAHAQVYLSSDIRYHDFVDYGDEILLVDIGHFESEQCTKDIFYEIITQKFANFAVYKSTVEHNPMYYFTERKA